MGRDFYAILHISKTATDDEIKKAYRKLALQYHPDKNQSPQAEENFKEVAAAYEVLSNKEKRAAFDKFGEDGLGNGSDAPTFTQSTTTDEMLPFLCVIGGTLLFAFGAYKTYEHFTKKKTRSAVHREDSTSD